MDVKVPALPENERTDAGTTGFSTVIESIHTKSPVIQELIERMDCEVVRESTIFPEDNQEAKKDSSLLLHSRAEAVLDKINLDELPKGPFQLTSSVEIMDVHKFVKAQRYLLEHVSPERIVYRKAVEGFWGKVKDLESHH